MQDIKLVNLTGRKLVILAGDGSVWREYEPDGDVHLRETHGGRHWSSGCPAMVREPAKYEVTGLPEPQEGTWYVVPVSAYFALRYSGCARDDVFAPSTCSADVTPLGEPIADELRTKALLALV